MAEGLQERRPAREVTQAEINHLLNMNELLKTREMEYREEIARLNADIDDMQKSGWKKTWKSSLSGEKV